MKKLFLSLFLLLSENTGNFHSRRSHESLSFRALSSREAALFRRITLILIYLVERICICIHAYVCVYVCVRAEQRVEKQCPM